MEKKDTVVKAAALTTVDSKMGAAAQAVAFMSKYLAAMSAADREVVKNTTRSMTIE